MGGGILRKVTIGNCDLYHGDCLEILPTLDKVDCLVTDPPYRLTSGGKNDAMRGKLSPENYDNSGGIVECKIDWPDFMPVIFQALKDRSHAYVMCNNRHIQNMLVAAQAAGFKFHNFLAWDKGTATPNRWYMKNLEFTGFFYKGKAFYINDCGSNQLHRVPNILNAKHPTEKPMELMRLYVDNSTQPGQVVLDSFMGGGTTGVACAKSGRKFIGIELNEKYFNLACDRIRAAYDAPELFRAHSTLEQSAMAFNE